jgi:T4-like virus tail tube protein gp19
VKIVTVVACAGLVALPLAAQAPVRPAPPTITLFVGAENVGSFRDMAGLGTANEVATQEPEIRPRAAAPAARSVTLRVCSMQCVQYLQAWRREVQEGRAAAARRTATIVLGNAARPEIVRYELTDAWPERLSLGTVGKSSGGSQDLDVTLVLVYAAMRVERGP